MTTIYFIRHANAFKNVVYDNGLSLQEQNERWILSTEGEKSAELFSKNEFLNDIDCVFSSNYFRAICTAKYIAENLDKNVFVMSEFSERKHGVSSFDELPSDFLKRQFLDENFKVGDGESRKEVTERMLSGLNKVLDVCRDKKVAIVSHATAITFLLMSFGDFKDEKLVVNDEVVFDKNFCWNNLDTIRVDFNDDDRICGIKLIKNDIMR